MGYVEIINLVISFFVLLVAATYIGYYFILLAGIFSKQKIFFICF